MTCAETVRRSVCFPSVCPVNQCSVVLAVTEDRRMRETDGRTGGSVCHAACHWDVGQQWSACDWWRPQPGACQSPGDKHPSGMHILASHWPSVSPDSIANILNSPQKGKICLLSLELRGAGTHSWLEDQRCVCERERESGPGTSSFTALKIKVSGFHVFVHAPFELMASP